MNTRRDDQFHRDRLFSEGDADLFGDEAHGHHTWCIEHRQDGGELRRYVLQSPRLAPVGFTEPALVRQGAPIALPDTFRPPYHGALGYRFQDSHGFAWGGTVAPDQDGPDEQADPQFGHVGHTLALHHNAGLFPIVDAATLHATCLSQIGIWYRIRHTRPIAIWVKATRRRGTGGSISLGSSLGSHLLRQDNYLSIEIYTHGQQGGEPAAVCIPVSSWPAIGDVAEELRLPAGVQRVVGAVTTGAYTAGSSIWIAIGTMSTHIGSSHNTTLESRSAVTWAIDEIDVRS